MIPRIDMPDPEAMERYLHALEEMRTAIERATGITFDMIMRDMAPDLRTHGMSVLRYSTDPDGTPNVEVIPAGEFYLSPDEIADDR